MRSNSHLKKLLMTTDNLGSIWMYSMEMLSELDNSGINTALAVMGADLTTEQRKEVNKFTNVSLHEGKFKLEWMENPWEDVDEAGEWLLTIRDEFHPEIVHLNSFSFGALNWGIPKVTVAHSDVLSWWKTVLNRPYPKRLNEYYKRVKFGLNSSDYIIAPSKTMLKYINELYGDFLNQKVIYNGRKASCFQPGSKEKYIFSMGRIWDTAKNIQLLINSAPMLKWKVKLAGPMQNPVTDETTLYGNVEFLGSLSSTEIAVQLSKASVFVLPAKYEPFGLSPLEAALSGCALVLGDIESLQEIWGDSAIYVDTDDKENLIDTVNNLISNESLLEHYAQKARKRGKEYTTDRMISEYMNVYDTVLKRNFILKD